MTSSKVNSPVSQAPYSDLLSLIAFIYSFKEKKNIYIYIIILYLYILEYYMDIVYIFYIYTCISLFCVYVFTFIILPLRIIDCTLNGKSMKKSHLYRLHWGLTDLMYIKHSAQCLTGSDKCDLCSFLNYFGLRRSPLILRMGNQGSVRLGACGGNGGCESWGRALDLWKGVNLVLWHSEKRRPPQGDLLGDPAEELGCELGFERALLFWEVLRKHFVDGMKEFVWLE